MLKPRGRPTAKAGPAAADIGRLVRTVVQLSPGQGVQRARLRLQRMALRRELPLARRWLLSGPDPGSAVGWPAEFTPLDAACWRDGAQTAVTGDGAGRAGLRGGEISLLGHTRAVAPADGAGLANWPAANWEPAGAPLLWCFHLHYWDWAWVLVGGERPRQAQALFTAIWQSWHTSVRPGLGTAWHPYPASLRAWSFCGIYRALAEGTEIEGAFRAQLSAQAGFIRRNLETDVGGNHLIKNLKALAGLAVFFADDGLLARTLGRLRRQLAVQVLPDGGHYERTPAYHCQVLGDLIDIAGLLRAAGRDGPPGLADTIEAMRRWLGLVLTPAGELPLLNDGFPVSPAALAALEPGVPPAGPLHLLPDTGLARAAVGGWHLLADVGLPCPRELPAHAHADTLSCLVHVDNEPLLIDTGTSTYAPGQARARERSTAAHNTVEVDRHDSTEVWGVFRAGRRARVLSLSAGAGAGAVTVEAAHDGYRGLRGRPRHHRRWTLRAGELRVDDTVTGQGRHRVTVRWQLAPGARLRLIPGGAEVTTRSGQFTVTATTTATTTTTATALETAGGGLALAVALSEVSAGFGRTVPAPVLSCDLHPELPVRIATVWRRSEPHQESR
jgi:uncharacterized heparinase superfamily protein